MSFESGSISFRAFYVPKGLPEDVVSKFAKNALPPVDAIGRDGAAGWVTGRHMLDRNITDDTARMAGYLRLCLVTAEKKVPDALLKAECKMEELAVMQAEGLSFIKRADRIRIRKDVMARLQPTMPPTLNGISMVHDANRNMLYATATSDSKCDKFTLEFNRASGSEAVPVDVATAAKMRKDISVSNFGPGSFSPNVKDVDAVSDVGQDFLTWLWFYSEAKGGTIEIQGKSCAVAIGGPITLLHEAEGAHVAVLKDGNPMMSSEIKPAMLSGKKLSKAKVTIARGEEMWETTFDAKRFTFGSLKMPKGDEKLDAVSAFQQRMVSLDTFMEIFLQFHDKFLAERSDAEAWGKVKGDIVQWILAKY
jgi:hypothetical protein